MKSKASLILMEQLVAVLVFALAAAMCLRLFVGAEQLSGELSRRDQAVTVAQNAAELLKAGLEPEDAECCARLERFIPQITEENSGISGLRRMRIDVYYDDSLLFTLTVGLQEVEP